MKSGRRRTTTLTSRAPSPASSTNAKRSGWSNFKLQEIPSPIIMKICYNTHVLRDSGEPYRSRTGEDRLPRPPCGRIVDLHDSKHDVHRKYWSYFTRSERHGCGLCAPLGRLARFDAFVSGLTRASGECMGEGKSAPSSCIRRGAGRRRERARQQERKELCYGNG